MQSELRRQFLQELLSKDLEKIASIWLLDRIPFLFQEDRGLYIDWKFALAKKLGIDCASILIVGSSCTGISFNPYKNYKPFDNTSDIDVAIVSDYYFNEAWRALRNLGSRRHSLPPREKQSIEDHVQRHIYWGTIASEHILPLFPFGSKWQRALSEMSSVIPTMGRQIKLRIYKDFESLRSYHINNLKSLRDNALS
ncbi:hypothetical protein HC891_03525 [Candidatus Gracilibacteria bacterium]|nr:hypothetical protein [Candidatus Gracilibacteria bacterium]